MFRWLLFEPRFQLLYPWLFQIVKKLTTPLVSSNSTSNLGRGRMSLKGGRWHERTDCDFEDNAFGELREGKDFTDVTLACEDGQQVEAHKVVLTSSSPFF